MKMGEDDASFGRKEGGKREAQEIVGRKVMKLLRNQLF